MQWAIALFAVLAVLIGIYLYFFIRRIFATFHADVKKKGMRVAIIAITAILTVLCVNIFAVWAIIILHIIVLAMLVQLVNFIIKKAAKEKYDGMKVWRKLYGSGIIPIFLAACMLIYGYYNMMHVVETDYTIHTSKAIREEGYRLALIADIHFGVSVSLDILEEKCDEISEKNPDIVILCGDIVDENTTREEMEKVFGMLSTIDSTYGIYYVYGNHDRQLYRQNRAYTEDELKRTIEGYGITILRDETVAINDELVIAGREDASYPMARASVAELLKDADKENFLLVLDHQPKEYQKNSEAGTDLLLSGHTHGGQIWPANLLFKIIKFDDAVYGYTLLDKMQAFVTSGFAGWGYPIKTSAPAEYVILDILPE